MTYPVDIKTFPVTTPYGVKGPRWVGGIHKGIDQACPKGTVVKSPVTGTVIGVGNEWGSAFGRHQCVIEFVSGRKTYWVILAHMSAYSVKAGDKVLAGKTTVGKSGAEGNVTGPHMHMEVQTRKFWTKTGYVNPSVAVNFPSA